MTDGVVEIDDGRIVEGPADRVIDLGDWWIVPGFIDVHVHGGGGAQFNTLDADEARRAVAFHVEHGTTGLLATVIPAPDVEEILATLTAAGLGVHLEGPAVSSDYPGALDPRWFRDTAVRARRVTLAPEIAAVRPLVEAGVSVSLGHSGASYAQACAAADAGASSVTHLFNAMAPFHHRAPGLVGAALDRSELVCELILDGIHVDPAAARIALRCKGVDGICLVTDAVAAAGMADGRYRLAGREIEARAGRAVLPDTDTIAGSTLTMDAAVRNAVEMLGVTVPEAVGMASSVPARLLGLGDRKGALAPGYDADLTVLDDELRCVATMIGGRWAFGGDAVDQRP